jgi:NAD+ kinase
MIAYDARNPSAIAMRERLLAVYPEAEADDLVYVVGGDGFLLATVDAHGFDRTYLGLNAGRLGFLLNDVADWAALAEALGRRAFTTHAFPVLQAELQHMDGTTAVVRAVNDVYLERATGQTARLRVMIGGETLVDTLVADGLIFATALGSTAYSFSAGGTAAHPALRSLFVTPICAHKPRLPSFALPGSAVVEVEVLEPVHRPVRAVADGRGVEAVTHVRIAEAPESVHLAYLEGHDFTRCMLTKLMQPS